MTSGRPPIQQERSNTRWKEPMQENTAEATELFRTLLDAEIISVDEQED